MSNDINSFPNKPWFFMFLQCKSFENTAGKGEIAHNEQFLLFPQCFLPIYRSLKLLSANCLSLEESKICHFGKGLRPKISQRNCTAMMTSSYCVIGPSIIWW